MIVQKLWDEKGLLQFANQTMKRQSESVRLLWWNVVMCSLCELL